MNRETLKAVFLVFFFLTALFNGFAQNLTFLDDPPSGDPAAAERYAIWGRTAAEEGRWNELLSAMERASDFSDYSSDISYLLALAVHNTGGPRYKILESLYRAFAADIWLLYESETARYFLIEQLLLARLWHEALDELSWVRSGPRQAELTLRALAAVRPEDFRAYLSETLDRYPRDSGPVRVFLNFITALDNAGQLPAEEDFLLLDLVIRRLPALLLNDPELAWMAAPYVYDLDFARRLVLSYRAVNDPVPASLPIALNLGIIDEDRAMEELFFHESVIRNGLDLGILNEVWNLLRHDNARALFRRYLNNYTGVIFRDANRDGVPEIFAEYINSYLVRSVYNSAQDGIPDLIIYYETGEPREALVLLPPETHGRETALLIWERYPSVLEAEYLGARFIPRPFDFFYQPVLFLDLFESGLFFPNPDTLNPPLTGRVLVSEALRIERPSLEFSGAVEIIELNRSIPIEAREYADGQLISITGFIQGRPSFQRLDLNMDGEMDTLRVFYNIEKQIEIDQLWNFERNIEYTISDWDGNIIRN